MVVVHRFTIVVVVDIVILIGKQLLAIRFGWLKSEQIVANVLAATAAAAAATVDALIGARIKVTIRVGVEQQLLHFLAIRFVYDLAW